MKKKYDSRICIICGCAFTPHLLIQKRCSSRCKPIETLTKRCIQCHVLLPRIKYKFCSYECQTTYWSQYRTNKPSSIKLPTATTGTISELQVAKDLLSKGYYVFRSMTPNSPCDLITLKDGILKRVEVRTANPRSRPNFFNHIKITDGADCWAFVLPNEIIYYPESFN